MRKYRSDDLLRFLEAVDRRLHEPFRFVVIGGSAALLGYGIDRVTRDIDTVDGTFKRFSHVFEAARQETGLQIPIDHAAVFDAPHDYEDRLLALSIPELKNIQILVPEKHDLVLMKTMRAEEIDLETAKQIQAAHGIDRETLILRWIEEMDHVIGDRRRLDLNLLALIERLFGEPAARETGNRVEAFRQARRRS